MGAVCGAAQPRVRSNVCTHLGQPVSWLSAFVDKTHVQHWQNSANKRRCSSKYTADQAGCYWITETSLHWDQMAALIKDAKACEEQEPLCGQSHRSAAWDLAQRPSSNIWLLWKEAFNTGDFLWCTLASVSFFDLLDFTCLLSTKEENVNIGHKNLNVCHKVMLVRIRQVCGLLRTPWRNGWGSVEPMQFRPWANSFFGLAECKLLSSWAILKECKRKWNFCWQVARWWSQENVFLLGA